MSENPLESYVYQHLRPIEIKDKELLLGVTTEIEDSFTGVVHIIDLHKFFIESSYLIRNGVALFEMGFFDSAFYSVRSAVELARVVTYFSNDDKPIQSELYKSWASGGKFPFDSQIKNGLEATGTVYRELYTTLPDFFEEQKTRLKKMQKYVHKQGYKSFYYTGPTNTETETKRNAMLLNDFQEFLTNSIAEIALLRLCIDPFPVLLSDPVVRKRIHFESLTYPFSDDLQEKIIGKERIDSYRSTDFYKSHAEYFMANEELCEEALALINNQFYNRKGWPTISKQLHLLSTQDKITMHIFNTSKKIAKVYTIGGIHWYFSDVRSKRTSMNYSNSIIQKVSTLNVPYDEVFLSHFKIDDEDYWAEHNSKLTEQEITKIHSIHGAIDAD